MYIIRVMCERKIWRLDWRPRFETGYPILAILRALTKSPSPKDGPYSLTQSSKDRSPKAMHRRSLSSFWHLFVWAKKDSQCFLLVNANLLSLFAFIVLSVLWCLDDICWFKREVSILFCLMACGFVWGVGYFEVFIDGHFWVILLMRC